MAGHAAPPAMPGASRRMCPDQFRVARTSVSTTSWWPPAPATGRRTPSARSTVSPLRERAMDSGVYSTAGSGGPATPRCGPRRPPRPGLVPAPGPVAPPRRTGSARLSTPARRRRNAGPIPGCPSGHHSARHFPSPCQLLRGETARPPAHDGHRIPIGVSVRGRRHIPRKLTRNTLGGMMRNHRRTR